LQDHNSSEKNLKKRLFIAISLPEQLLQNLNELQTQLKRFAKEATWVRPQGIHLTLKFLGYVDPKRIPEISERLSKISNDSFDIEVRGFGFFPNPRRPSVLWVKVQSQGLLHLQQKVEDAMTATGFEKENRSFSPHLTLARFKTHHGLAELSKMVEERSNNNFGKFRPKHFELFESILHRDGAEYLVVQSFSLED
jgi:2'-5' RNA ligase